MIEKSFFLLQNLAVHQIDTSRDDLGVDAACDLALRELGIEYLDLYLLHAPDRTKPIKDVLNRMAHLVKRGKIRAFGVSNFTLRHLKEFHVEGIVANQIELHPLLFPQELLAYCKRQKITPIAFRSLGKGELLSHPFVLHIAEKYEKTPAQILLRWQVQQHIPVIAKASNEKHLLENLQIFDFEISEIDMEEFAKMHSNTRFCEGAWADFSYV